MSLLTGTRRALIGGAARIKYLLRATFNTSDQGYTNGQVLDIHVEGVQDGQLTVVEVDGTLAIVSNKCAFTAQATPTWGDLGFYSQAVTRALGRGLLGTVSKGATNTEGPVIAWYDSAVVDQTNQIYMWIFVNDGNLEPYTFDGVGNLLDRNQDAIAYSASTDYQLAIVLGGFSAANGIPWRQGEDPAGYLYGAAFFIKESAAFPTWTLLWRTSQGNTATLYAAFSNYNAAGTID